MKSFFYLGLALLTIMNVACNETKKPVKNGGIDVTNLDRSAIPGDDFYQYACGGWMKKHPLTDEYARFGSFDLLAENNRTQVKELIEQMAVQPTEGNSIESKIGRLYNMAMDSTKLNADGIYPMQQQLLNITNIKSREEFPALIARMRTVGFSPFFGVYVGADQKNSDMNIVNTYQSGMSLGQREYYLDNDDNTVDIRNKYKEHIVKMFALSGFSEEESKKASDDVLKIETLIAENSKSNVELRDPLGNYNKMSLSQLKNAIPNFEWDVYFNTLGLNDLQELNVSQIKALEVAVNILQKENMNVIKHYLQWKAIDAAASFLNDELYAQNFEFYGKTLSGRIEMEPRWKRAVSTVNGVLGEAVGKVYTEKYFPAEAKERMIKLVSNLQEALGERIQGLEWMSDDTKKKAMEKLAAFHVKIGYPDKWKDYSDLALNSDYYWGNIMESNIYDFKEMIDKAGKPVDKDEWLMTPQTVNAYYNPTTNEICFPAAILQYPFFDMAADDACNYGAIGVVIGHEMTHGFDDQGRNYDKEGNLNEWWTNEDAERFAKRAQVLVDYFNNIEVLPGLNANGELSLGENIADHGGLQVSYVALQKAMNQNPLGVDENGFTPEQRFFLAYANVWAGNIREEQIRLLTRIDVHSLGEWRVNGALPHIDAWYKAFNVTEENALYIPKEDRASIW